jgi:hypothetical protein
MMNPAIPPEEIRLRISKLEELKETYRDDPEFCARQDIRIDKLKALLDNPSGGSENVF